MPEQKEVNVGQAREAVGAAKDRLPYPDDVLECVAVRAADDERLLQALESIDEKQAVARADQAAAECVVQVRTAPRFAEDLQRAAAGSLSKEQLLCAIREFSDLTPQEVEAASGAVLNPSEAEPSDLAPIQRIYETCDIELGDG